jgi:hypothetical protein
MRVHEVLANPQLGTPAEEHFSTRSPIFENNSEATFQLINNWMKECAEHPNCNKDESDTMHIPSKESPTLPTRVLEISGSHEKPSVRIVETIGQRADYCALSHCWGQKQPIRTTSDNFHKHLTDVPFESLPKTFRDAVYLAQGINIPYLWIDSLCIIQDNVVDWAREAKLMGGLYHDATLVIAAAGAEDSTRGLFVAKRPSIAVPYRPAEFPDATFLITIISDRAAADPYWHVAPLRNRAWAYQEWFLAQRIEYFMPGGLTWNCPYTHCSDRGSPIAQRSKTRWDWSQILQEYCQRRLTKSSDRLVAIQGIVDKLSREENSASMYHFGVWSLSIMEQLLWRVGEKFERGVLDVPSWSWAASECRKHWLTPPCTVGPPTVFTRYRELTLSSDGVLHASGYLFRLNFSEEGMLPCCRDRLFPRVGEYSIEHRVFQDQERNSPRQLNQHRTGFDMHLAKTQTEEVIGFAVFDEHRIEDVVCFLAGKEKRQQFDDL